MAVQLDAQAFKALSSPTRISLLKKLYVKPRSLSSLAEESGLSVQATDEHMHKLVKAGLVQKDKKNKWAYYHLTASGRSLVAPDRQPVYLMLAASMMLLLAAAITWNQAGVFASSAQGSALPALAEIRSTQSQPMESASKSAITAADANGTAAPAAPRGQPVLDAASAQPSEAPSFAQSVPEPTRTRTQDVEPAAMPLVYLFAAGGALTLAIAVYWWRRRGV
ncbi:helix-turn-helix domain-containing protein [Candidatus Micrarchaeota archaeon]|nr:helix-turn-helix domain-containing protein [Candidatus Micrarchaeota archaeon]